jgi:hypothetical protein
MYLYNSYCYDTLNLAAQSFYSRSVIDGFGVLNSYSLISIDTVNFVYLLPNNTLSNFDYKFIECFKPGFDNSFFGFTPADSFEISWASAIVICSVYGFKVIKKMLEK